MSRIDLDSDAPKKVYEHIRPIWGEIVSEEDRRAQQAIKDYMGYINPAVWPPNEHHIPTMKLFRQETQKVSRDYMALIAKYPYFPIEAKKEEEQYIVDAITDVMQVLLENMKYKMHMDMLLRIMSNLGIVYAFPYWRVRMVKYPVSLDLDTDEPEKQKQVAVDSIQEEGLGIKIIPAYMGCLDPRSGYDHTQASWGFFRENISKYELEQLVRMGRLRLKMSELEGMQPDDAGSNMASLFNRSEQIQDTITVDHILMKNRYVMVVNKEHVVRDTKYNPWTPGRINMVPFKNEVPPDPKMYGGLSDNHIVGRTNFGYEMAKNTKFNSMRQALNMIMQYNPLYVNNKNDLTAGHGNIRIAVSDIEKAVNILQPPQTSPDLQRLPDEIENLCDDTIGIQDYERGGTPSPMPQATVFKGMQEGPSTRLSHRYDRLEEALGDLCLHFAVIADKYASPAFVYQILGNRAYDVIRNLQDPNGSMLLDPRKLSGGYTLGFEASQKANEHDRQLAAVEKWFNITARDPDFPPIARAEARAIYTDMALLSLPKHKRDKIIQPIRQHAMMLQQQMQAQMQGGGQFGQNPTMLPSPLPSGSAVSATGARSAMPGMRMGEMT